MQEREAKTVTHLIRCVDDGTVHAAMHAEAGATPLAGTASVPDTWFRDRAMPNPRHWLLPALLLLGQAITPAPLAAAPASARGTDADRPGKPGETAAMRNTRLRGFRHARFGMFVHWGLYAQAAGQWQGRRVDGYGEWLQANARVPAMDYAALATQFDPVEFDAHAWVALAQAAGMGYLVFTAKHHDGFAMYDSQVDDFDIVARTPWGRDPLAELADAARAAGLPLGLYYSQNLDWHDPDARGNDWEAGRRKAGGDFDAYMRRKALPQLAELLDGRYGEIAELWWDYPADATQEEGDRFRTAAWSRQPRMVMNDRGGGRGGDFGTPEQAVPAHIVGEPDFEVCMTLNDTWGYRADDSRWKSPRQLLAHLVDTVSQGGNFLLNVGPDARGRIPAPSVEILQRIGRWMDVNGDAIRDARRCPLPAFPDGVCTRTPGQLHLFVKQWPAQGRLRLDMPFRIQEAWLQGARTQPLAWSQGEQLEITLPPQARTQLLPVLTLTLATGPATPEDATGPGPMPHSL